MVDESLINLNGQVLPFSLEAEQAVIGAVLLDPSCMDDLVDLIKPDYFYLPQHHSIFSIMYEMSNLSKKIDSITVLEELKKQNVYDDASGKTYLLQLAQMVPTAKNAATYAKIIKEKYYVRALILASREIINDSSLADVDADMLLDSAEQRIYEIRRQRETGGLKHIKEVITGETMVRLEKLTKDEYKDEFAGIPTGISAIDKITGGMHKSDLIILGARPGMGKTSMALNIARNVAVIQNKVVCVFSLEMTREQLAERLIAAEAAIASTKLRTGDLDSNDWSRFAEASAVLSKSNMFLDETSNITVPEMKARLRRMPKVDLVLIDYLGLMNSPRKIDNRVQEISEITRSLKLMAKELMVPIICCSQLARSTEGRGKSHRPQLSDLRDSGSIEQDADSVLFLYREFYYANETENPDEVDVNKAECIIAKNRHGEIGTAHLRWDPQFTKFSTPDYRTED